jgi:hypothetical protein
MAELLAGPPFSDDPPLGITTEKALFMRCAKRFFERIAWEGYTATESDACWAFELSIIDGLSIIGHLPRAVAQFIFPFAH